MLIDEVKKSIVAAGFKDGDKMPSVRKMALQLDMSVTTIHKAYRELAAEGTIKLIQGKGCFWGKVPAITVRQEEDVYSSVDRLFLQDLDRGNIGAFDPIPSANELASRYSVSPYIVKKFLLRKVEQGILRQSGRRFFFNEERSVESTHYILFVHRSDEFGKMKIESERESGVFRTLTRIAAEQKIGVRFLGYNEASDTLISPSGVSYVAKGDENCLGIFLSTWLVADAQRLFAHFAKLDSPISVWWEYAPDTVPVSIRNKKKWAFYNVAFGKEAGKIVGDFLRKKKVEKVHYISPYHASFWSKARMQGVEESGIEVVPLVKDLFASPFDVKNAAVKAGEDIQQYMNGLVEELLSDASLSKFVCSNDWVATTIIDLCKSKNRPIPYVIGFDDTVDSYRYVFDSCAFNVETMVREALYHIVAPTIYAEQRRQMQAPLGRVVEKK